MAKGKIRTRLGRTLGLTPTLTIGIGTMVGAGIFIFPGMAAGEAGPAALVSFVIGGVIALVVALCTAELVTAMPKNGGAYFFISRAMGPYTGTLAGIGQWIGLISVTAFYLTGFGEYVIRMAEEAGLSLHAPVTLIALGSALLLTTVNIFGTRGAGQLQNGIVLVLSGILSVLFFYGLLKSPGTGAAGTAETPFAPMGMRPVFTSAALIFTSYLGFAQIATVAGEVKDPQKNLPKALIGSVGIVMILYVLAVFVSTRVIPYTALGEMQETAMVEVGRRLVGKYGAIAILLAGVLATLSSANASILSSSRAVYALGKDRIMPKQISRVNKTFNTPHITLLVTGFAIAAITVYGKIEILAEVSSFLHLILYAGICLSLFKLRRRKPLWFVPTFKIPGGPVFPIIGSISCISLIVFMESVSILIGIAILAIASIWYLIFIRPISLPSPVPPHISPPLRSPRVIAPVDLSDPKPVPVAILRAFREIDLMIVGYRVVKEQLSPEQAESKYGEESEKILNDLTKRIQDLDAETDTEVLFTADFARGLRGVLEENACQIVMTLREISSVERILVPIYHRSQINRALVTVVRELAISDNIPVAFVLFDPEGDESEAYQAELQQFLLGRFRMAGLAGNRFQVHKLGESDLVEAVAQLSDDNDIVVIAEANVEKRSSLFRTLHSKLRDILHCPVLVVLKHHA